MIFGSTSKNVNLFTLLTTTIAIVGLFYFNFSLTNIFYTIISFYIFNIIGVWMMLHRYFSHKAFAFKHKFLQYLFTSIAVLSCRGSIISWVYIHRQHHAHSDTDKDPHSPKALGYKIFGFGHYKEMEADKMKIFLVKDLMVKEHLFIHKYYFLLICSFITLLAIYNIEFLYFLYILPITLVHLSQNHFNYFGHLYGYRNFETKDNSRNNIWLFPFILGEAWHNNHHHNPSLLTTKVKFYEIDPISFIISFIKTKS